ncbi:MAG: S41 family peptidase [Allisonella histaminiformans]|uniref:S41 family peptidase n=1 Tax=Allisonella histaminiformans TaxID=209880 RepID=UPI002A824868|nr:S41 family peptidase [Allisonella histaminiformans]MDY4540281.1 S41 family peptidase [Allisonella histaminiformans]
MKKFTDFSWKKGGLWIVSSLVGAMAIIGLFLFTFFDSPKAFLQFLHDYQIIRTRYFRPVSDETLFQGAVKGMASSLGDPYSLYLTGDVYKSFMEQTTAAFGGVGIIIGEDKQGDFYILAVFKKGAAHDAGIQPGGKLVAVDGKKLHGMEPMLAANLVRGKVGTAVTLTIEENGKVKDYKMHRSDVVLPTVSDQMVSGDIGYIHIYTFATHTGEEFKEALRDVKAKGARKLIIDVRMNPGGLITSVVDVADQILTHGPVVSYQAKNGTKQTFDIDGISKPMPMVILIDRNSASASEILAGAVQDKKEGIVMGEKSFGKGTIQSVEELSDGTALKISIAQYLTAGGRKIDKIGIKPDVAVQQTGTPFDMNSDSVLQEAIRKLK